MQMSATRHWSTFSMVLTVALASSGTGSDVFASATCTGGVSGGRICDGSGNAAQMIDSSSSEAAVVSVAIPFTGSATVATSALATAMSLAAVACGASAS